MTTEEMQRRIRLRLGWIEQDLKDLDLAPFNLSWAQQEGLVSCIRMHADGIDKAITRWEEDNATQ